MPTTALKGLYAIVDMPHPHGLDPVGLTRAVLGDRLDGGSHGAAIVQLRAKSADEDQTREWLAAMSASCQEAGVALVCNDLKAIALQMPEVTGLHLGQDDDGADEVAAIRQARSDLLVGLSTHDIPQLREALRQRPDYVAFGPVARTRTKVNHDPVVGLSGLTDAARITSRPLVAIGGLDSAKACTTIRHGADMAAVIGALTCPTLDQTRQAAITLASELAEAARPLTLDEVCEAIPVLERDLLAELARWGDSLSVHMALELPARFAPRVEDGQPIYRYCEVLDLITALGKRPNESWEQWKTRGHDDPDGTVVQLRTNR